MANPYAIKLAPSAIEDLKEATEWYASRLSEGLAVKFIKAVDTTLT